MTALSELFSIGYRAYKSFNSLSSEPPSTAFKGMEVTGSSTPAKAKALSISSLSNFNLPISQTPGRLAGFGRGWGQASADIQHQVMDLILTESSHLSVEDQAVLLGIARVESGFNPDAAATTTSASGVFQLVRETASNLDLSQDNLFNARENILAGVSLFEENTALVNQRFPGLAGNERAVMLYAFHHDGPSLSYGGAEIARRQLLPFLDDFRALTYEMVFNESY